MSHELTDNHNGPIQLLSKSLGSQELKQHRAMVAVELEVLAKKFDRFGWDRDRGSMAHDRTVTDWMDALHNYTLDEIKAACIDAVLSNPNKMPNEGHIRAIIIANRQRAVAAQPSPESAEEPRREPISADARQAIMDDVGFSGKVKVKSFKAKPGVKE